MEQNYNEIDMAKYYFDQIRTKRNQGFTDEQIAKDLSLPTEVVARCDTSCSEGPTHPGFSDLPDNPAEDDTEKPFKEDTPREEGETDSGRNSEEKGMGTDNIDVKEEYTLEQSAEDMFSDDAFKNLKAEFAQCKIRHNKLVAHIAAVMTEQEDDLMPVEMLQIKADAMQTYLTCLGVEMNTVKKFDKKYKELKEEIKEEK